MRQSFPVAGSKSGTLLSTSEQDVQLNLMADPLYHVKKVRLVVTNTADKDAFIYVKGSSRNAGLLIPASGGTREDVFAIGEDADYVLNLLVVADDAPTNNGVVRCDISPAEYGGKQDGS